MQPTLGFFFEVLTDYDQTGNEPALAGIIVDSRDAAPDTLFVASKHDEFDNHGLVAQAFEFGAIAALVERMPKGLDAAEIDIKHLGSEAVSGWDGRLPVCILVENSLEVMKAAAAQWRLQFDVDVIGITGSVGKSSTKELTYSVLSQRYCTFASHRNQNSPLELAAALFDLRPEHDRAVLEIGISSAESIAQLCKMTRPKIGVVTIIGPVHLGQAGSLEAIVASKQELVEALPREGTAVLNFDDKRVMEMAKHTQAKVFSYGLDPKADLWADNIHSMGLDGVRFTLHRGYEAVSLGIPILGRHSVHTALRAAAVGLIEDLSWEEIVAGLSQADVAQFRIEAVPGPRGSTIIDDTYNSSPESALAALNLLAELDGRRIAVLGDMLELGSAEEHSHRLVGRRAADVADILVAVGPRSQIIAQEAQAIGMRSQDVSWVSDAAAAVPLLDGLIRKGDVLLVKGSLGMHMDRIVAALGGAN